MNGLRYIRTRCNLSLNDLADLLGVTRQALSAWENGRKAIPQRRQEQLATFFGIDKAYFGEISEKEKKYLLEKAMFRYNDNGKESYRYKPKDDEVIYFAEDTELSLDEKYLLAQKQKKETIEKIEDIIKWKNHAGDIQSQITAIHRGCTVYNMVTELMETMRNQKVILKIPFFFEIDNILKAMLLAYGLMEEKQLSSPDEAAHISGEDTNWILQLSEQIREHWDASQNFYETISEN